MASLNTRDAGRDFEGNGPSSFDPRRNFEYDAAGSAASDDTECPVERAQIAACLAGAMAQIDRAFGPEARAKYAANQAAKLGRAA